MLASADNLFDWLFIISFFAALKRLIWLLDTYSAITEHVPCDLGLITLLLLGQMYSKLNHYVII